MKTILAAMIATALVATAGAAFADSGSLVQFKPKVMPVVVSVNAEGKITEVNPSLQLKPAIHRLLVQQIQTWITKPAMVKGRPVSSRFIIDVAMRAKPAKDGNYSASFVYVKSMAMPYYGQFYWDHIDGGLELAMVFESGPNRVWRMHYDNVGFPRNPGPWNHATGPAVHDTMVRTAQGRRSATTATPAARSAAPAAIAAPAPAPAPMPAMMPAPQMAPSAPGRPGSTYRQ